MLEKWARKKKLGRTLEVRRRHVDQTVRIELCVAETHREARVGRIVRLARGSVARQQEISSRGLFGVVIRRILGKRQILGIVLHVRVVVIRRVRSHVVFVVVHLVTVVARMEGIHLILPIPKRYNQRIGNVFFSYLERRTCCSLESRSSALRLSEELMINSSGSALRGVGGN